MKKLLLTLGSAAAAVAPVATVVACGDADSVTLVGSRDVVDGHLTLKGFVGPTYTEDEDMADIMNKLTTFSNRMGIELVAAGADVTKVTFDGELPGNDGQLIDVTHTHDLAALGMTDLATFIGMFSANEDGDTASGLAFQALSNPTLDSEGGSGEDSHDDDLAAIKSALDSMVVSSTISEAAMVALGDGNKTLAELGFADDYFDSIAGERFGWKMSGDYSLDTVGMSIAIGVQYESETDVYDITLPFADITFG